MLKYISLRVAVTYLKYYHRHVTTILLHNTSIKQGQYMQRATSLAGTDTTCGATRKYCAMNVVMRSVSRFLNTGCACILTIDVNFQGSQPYWNWFKHQDNLRESPVFDGSDTSLGSDGSFVAHNGSVGGTGKIFMPSGQGGGCIMSGPFKVSQWRAVV
jgi:hypothetical protein